MVLGKVMTREIIDQNPLISYIIPCMGRLYELEIVMPLVIAAANVSPPIEILVLNYNSPDGLSQYMEELINKTKLTNGNIITHYRYTKPKYYQIAHSRNLASKKAKGEWLLQSAAGIYLEKGFFVKLREFINSAGADFYRIDSLTMPGVIAIPKEEFIKAGGYDERFEFYGSEDRDLNSRLERRGLKYGLIDRKWLHSLADPVEEKSKNYRLKLSKFAMTKINSKIYAENVEKQVLVANKGNDWGIE